MGIYHFAPIGKSPGAVTSGLSYLKHNRELLSEKGSIIENIILFTSPEIAKGKEKVNECVFNEYGTKNQNEKWVNQEIFQAVCRYIEKEIAQIMPKKAKVLYCSLNPNDFNDCFQKIAKAALKFSPPGKTGKHIWANITGGTNVMNAALFHVAFLCGLISRIYYTFLRNRQDIKYLQPPSTNTTEFGCHFIPIVKTDFDETYKLILCTYKTINGWIKDEEILSMLKRQTPLRFQDIDIQNFRKEWLNKMDGKELERKNGENRLSDYGKETIKTISDPLFARLIERGKGKEVGEGIGGLKLHLLWSKDE